MIRPIFIILLILSAPSCWGQKDSTQKIQPFNRDTVKTSKGDTKLPIYRFGFEYLIGKNVQMIEKNELTEEQMLKLVEKNTIDRSILSEIYKTRKARKNQRILLITGGVGIVGGFWLFKSDQGRYNIEGPLIGASIFILSIPIELISLVPYSSRRHHAQKVIKLYNASLLN